MSRGKIFFWLSGILILALVAGGMVFFTTYEVKSIEVHGNTKYSDEEVKDMVLSGFFANNTVLAPIFCSEEEVDDTYLVDGWTVTQISNDTLAINFNERKPVGCISYLDSYVYFDRNGKFVDAAMNKEEQIPYFNGIQVSKVVENEKLPIKGKAVLNAAVTLATIFQKDAALPDYVSFNDKNQVSLVYDKVTVSLGRNEYIEDKMARAQAILPLIEGKEGILHMESVTDTAKQVTFEPAGNETLTKTSTEWTGGYDANGEYTGVGEYDERGKFVGPPPLSDFENALEKWPGGYDGEGDFTGSGEYDANGNYVGAAPNEDSFAALGDWKGGYSQEGVFTWTGEYDRDGNYVGPNPGSSESDGSSSDSLGSYFEGEASEEGTEASGETSENVEYTEENSGYTEETGNDGYSDGSYDNYDESYDESAEGSQEDGGIYDESYYDALYEGIYW